MIKLLINQKFTMLDGSEGPEISKSMAQFIAQANTPTEYERYASISRDLYNKGELNTNEAELEEIKNFLKQCPLGALQKSQMLATLNPRKNTK